MRALVCGLVLVTIAGITGCGGGGGGAQPALPTMVAADMVGTYQVRGLNLPGDQIGVAANGNVVVNADAPATRAGTQTKIGSCDARGTLVLNGSWTSGGVDYTITGRGSIAAASHSLTLLASVKSGSFVVQPETTVLGTRVGESVVPPPADNPGGGDDSVLPPPPPDDYGDDDDGMLPPPPPPDDPPSTGDDDGMQPPPPPPYDE